MQSINIDDGYQSFAINGDENRVIRFNPNDPNLLKRYYQAMEEIRQAKEGMGQDVVLNADGSLADGCPEFEQTARTLTESDDIIRKNINMMFNSDIFDAVFRGQSPFCIVGNGKFLFEAFLDSVRPVMEESIKKAAAASRKRVSKYLKGYTR